MKYYIFRSLKWNVASLLNTCFSTRDASIVIQIICHNDVIKAICAKYMKERERVCCTANTHMVVTSLTIEKLLFEATFWWCIHWHEPICLMVPSLQLVGVAWWLAVYHHVICLLLRGWFNEIFLQQSRYNRRNDNGLIWKRNW